MPDPATASPTYRLADALVPGGIAAYVKTKRDAGRSWRLISRDLWQDTDGQLDITFETLRSWFTEAAA